MVSVDVSNTSLNIYPLKIDLAVMPNDSEVHKLTLSKNVVIEHIGTE